MKDGQVKSVLVNGEYGQEKASLRAQRKTKSWNLFKERRKIVSGQVAVGKIAQRKQNCKTLREHEEERDIEINEQSNSAQENNEN